MTKIPKEVQEFLKGKMAWVATATSDGMPNTTPKGTVQVIDDEHVVFTDLFSRKTRENLQENPKVAMDMAAEMGIELLTEEQCRALQNLGEFDTKTSSWVKTPANIRKLGGAIFCDRRYDTIFVYDNGAESYYAARGFRGSLRV